MNGCKDAELRIPLTMAMLPVVVGFTESVAKILGLDEARSLRLGLAVEELFAFLAPQAQREEMIFLWARPGGYFVEMVCRVPALALPTRLMNKTAKMDLENEELLPELGILLAARMVDRFRLVMESDTEMALYFLVEKQYPELTAQFLPPPPGNYRYHTGSREELKQFSLQTSSAYQEAPDFFRFPGKVVDMVNSGAYEAVLATDDKGNVGGGMIWMRSGNLLEAYGPYVFQADLADGIVEKMLATVARSGALSLVVRKPTAEIPQHYFEELVPDSSAFSEESPAGNTVLYRQLAEDTGMVVFVPAVLKDFVTECYDRLVLPRDIVWVEPAGEKQGEHSVFSVTVDGTQKQAVITALLAGADARTVLQDYVSSLLKQGLTKLFFELDTGKEAEAMLATDLGEAGFTPAYVLPWGGQGDVIVFQYRGGA
ncbi:MAG TPA: hypothetical protein VN611_11720 [Patescibacteria group bacterium]|nr:hypothetical protein [Patescibacteria group bacterium]